MTTAPLSAGSICSEVTAKDLRHSRPLNWFRIGTTKETQQAIDFLLESLEASEDRKRGRKERDRANLRATLEAIVMDAYVARIADPELFLAYTRRKSVCTATARSRYGNPKVTLTAIVTAADWLAGEGLIENVLGFPGQMFYCEGWRSRLRATPALEELLKGFAVLPAMAGACSSEEIIILKGTPPRWGASKPRVEYHDTPATNRMRETLQQINECLAQAELDLCVPNGSTLAEPVDLTARRLYRVFNNESFKEGGRFYGGWWQRLPSKVRSGITIDGQPTVELE